MVCFCWCFCFDELLDFVISCLVWLFCFVLICAFVALIVGILLVCLFWFCVAWSVLVFWGFALLLAVCVCASCGFVISVLFV